jgi:DNA polymerase-3 subunit delta
MGDEDIVSNFIEKRCYQEEFNQTVLYGRDVTIEDIISTVNAIQ